jgi:hypothetical protein
MGLSREALDEICGFPKGYASKLLGNPPLRYITLDQAFDLMSGMGWAVVFVDDAKALARITDQVGKRNKKQVRTDLTVLRRNRERRVRKKLSKMGNIAFMEKTTPEQRSAAARKAIRARWKQWRALRRGKVYVGRPASAAE